MDFQHFRNQILRYPAGTPNQPRQIHHFTAKCVSVRHSVSFLCTKANTFGAQLRSRHARRVDSPPPRHSTSSGSPRLVQGRRWIVVAGRISASTTEGGVYLVRFSVDPRLIKLLLPPARYTSSTRNVRGSWYLQVYVDSAFPQGIQRHVDDPRYAGVVVDFPATAPP